MIKYWSTCVMLTQKMHIFADYFVTDFPANSPGNERMMPVELQLDFFTIPKKTENDEKTRISR